MSELKTHWEERMSGKGVAIYDWLLRYKTDEIIESMLPQVCVRAGLGDPPPQFTTNRVECVNSLLSDETNHKEQSLPEFYRSARSLVERQRRNVEWAIVNKGPYRLHKSLEHMEINEDIWCGMEPNEREQHIKLVFSCSVEKCKEITEKGIASSNEEIPKIQPDGDFGKIGISLDDFLKRTEPYAHMESGRGIWRKALRLLKESGNISIVPGCDPHSRMVASCSNKQKPRLVTKGKGDYKCEKSCPNWSGLSICSHALATAADNGKVQEFLAVFCATKAKKNAKMSPLVTSNMPAKSQE